MWGKYRALVINEADKVQPAAQDLMLDWLEDELPEGYLVMCTTNAKVATEGKQATLKLSKTDKDEYLSTKFLSRLTKYHLDYPSTKEIAEGLQRITECSELVATSAAKASAGDLRQAFKELQDWIKEEIKQDREDLIVKSSCGNGSWAQVPHFSILNNK